MWQDEIFQRECADARILQAGFVQVMHLISMRLRNAVGAKDTSLTSLHFGAWAGDSIRGFVGLTRLGSFNSAFWRKLLVVHAISTCAHGLVGP